MEIVQEYSTDLHPEMYGYNQLLKDNLCEIHIYLGSLMERKNMAIKKLVDKIDGYFLLEYLCVLLTEEGLWSDHLCGRDGSNCSIKQALKKINYFTE